MARKVDAVCEGCGEECRVKVTDLEEWGFAFCEVCVAVDAQESADYGFDGECAFYGE